MKLTAETALVSFMRCVFVSGWNSFILLCFTLFRFVCVLYELLFPNMYKMCKVFLGLILPKRSLQLKEGYLQHYFQHIEEISSLIQERCLAFSPNIRRAP